MLSSHVSLADWLLQGVTHRSAAFADFVFVKHGLRAMPAHVKQPKEHTSMSIGHKDSSRGGKDANSPLHMFVSNQFEFKSQGSACKSRTPCLRVRLFCRTPNVPSCAQALPPRVLLK